MRAPAKVRLQRDHLALETVLLAPPRITEYQQAILAHQSIHTLVLHSLIVGWQHTIQPCGDPSIAIGSTGVADISDNRKMLIIVLFEVSRI
ncbi:hypothetical protein Q667_15760 [Marinobacter sp. C1S70]|nr:hypothetical protein Q667_15760 [Marinobacter sp. C1S70]